MSNDRPKLGAIPSVVTDPVMSRLLRDLEDREAKIAALAQELDRVQGMAHTVNVLLTVLLERHPEAEGDAPRAVVTPDEIARASRYAVQVHADGESGGKRVWLLRTPEDFQAAAQREKERQELAAIRERLP